MKKAYFIGIAGIGMSALAQMLKDHGTEVSGSDREQSPTTDLLAAKGIPTFFVQEEKNVPLDAEVVIYSEAVPEENPERVRAKSLGIPQHSYFEMLGKVSEGKRTLAVAGTHGKTTTTGMTARILRDAGVSPTAIVGSIVRDFGSNYLSGTSDLFVVEACEYKNDFRFLSPHILVVTNIEWDHTDYYSSLQDVQKAFRAMMEKVPAEGAIVTDATHPNIAPLLESLQARVIDYRTEPAYAIALPGEFNQMNAQAAAVAARAAFPDVSNAAIAASLAAFEGTWRRFEYKGKTKGGADLYDDYAHHPTAVRKTLAALRQKTAGRIFVAFHPHLFSRTRDLLPEFKAAFADADEILIAPIYAAREVDDGTMSNTIVAAEIGKTGKRARPGSFEEIERILLAEPREGDVVMLMGAGDIYKLAGSLVE